MTVVSKATFARILTAQITAVVLQQKVLQMVAKLLPQVHKCICKDGYTGDNCGNRVCPVGPSGKICSGHGFCDEEKAVCKCLENWGGASCAEKLPVPRPVLMGNALTEPAPVRKATVGQTVLLQPALDGTGKFAMDEELVRRTLQA